MGMEKRTRENETQRTEMMLQIFPTVPAYQGASFTSLRPDQRLMAIGIPKARSTPIIPTFKKALKAEEEPRPIRATSI